MEKRKNKGIGVTPETDAAFDRLADSLRHITGGPVLGYQLFAWLIGFAFAHHLLFADYARERLGIPRTMPEPGPDDGQPVPLEKLPY